MKKRTFKSIFVSDLVVGDTVSTGIGILNPPVNALSRIVREELRTALEDLDNCPDARNVTLYGIGKHFSAGADLRELQRIAHLKSPTERESKAFAFSRQGQRLIKQILLLRERLEVTAEVMGACTGGGFELALACSNRIVNGPLIVGLPETTLGLIPGWGGTILLPRTLFVNGGKHYPPSASALCNRQRVVAGELVANGKLFTHQEALDNFVVAARSALVGELEAVPLPLGRLVSLHARDLAMQAIPLGENATSLEEAFLREAKLFAKAMVHPDAKEGIDAFLEKRQPLFRL